MEGFLFSGEGDNTSVEKGLFNEWNGFVIVKFVPGTSLGRLFFLGVGDDVTVE